MKPKIVTATMPWAVLSDGRYCRSFSNRGLARIAKALIRMYSHEAIILRNVTIAGEVVR